MPPHYSAACKDRPRYPQALSHLLLHKLRQQELSGIQVRYQKSIIVSLVAIYQQWPISAHLPPISPAITNCIFATRSATSTRKDGRANISQQTDIFPGQSCCTAIVPAIFCSHSSNRAPISPHQHSVARRLPSAWVTSHTSPPILRSTPGSTHLPAPIANRR